MGIADRLTQIIGKDKKRKIVAIGGGEIIRDGIMGETRPIDKEIIRLSGKLSPKLLFIPTASHDSAGYCNNILAYYGTELGCSVDFLLLYSNPDPATLREQIMSADIIYVGGGNTYAMMKRWRALGVDEMLAEAAANGTVMSGLSAGAICWFRYGASDSRKLSNPDASMIKVSGLGWIDAVMCPHYDSEEHRDDYLKELMQKTPGFAIAVDDCCAIEIIGDEYRIISSKESANAYRIYWKKGEYFKELLPKTREYVSMYTLGG